MSTTLRYWRLSCPGGGLPRLPCRPVRRIRPDRRTLVVCLVCAISEFEQPWNILLQKMSGSKIMSDVEGALHTRITRQRTRQRCNEEAITRSMNPARSIADPG